MPNFNKDTHHLDHRADALHDVGSGGTTSPDDLLSSEQLAEWFGVSLQSVKAWRYQGNGPPFVRASANRIRYLRSDVLKWLKKRRTQCARKRG